MTPTDHLAARQRDYAKAVERHARAIERRSAAEERVQVLEREFADAEDVDRRTLGEALVEGVGRLPIRARPGTPL
jgi:hypothetical protein